jgi:protein SCO1/2
VKVELPLVDLRIEKIAELSPRIANSRSRAAGRTALLALALSFLLAGAAEPHDDKRPAALRDVAFDQKLNQQVPLDLSFRNEDGKTVLLADYFKQKPVILNFVYLKCQDLCPLLLDGVVRSLRALSFDIGNQFDVLTVSFDPRDDPPLAAAKKMALVKKYSRVGAATGWRFLTGDEPQIRKLTESVGFRYSYDAQKGEFAHASGIIVMTPQGRTSRYFYGIDFSPRDLRLGLIEAAADKIGSPIDQLLLFCYHYDPTTGKYNLLVARVLQVAGAITVLGLGVFIMMMLRRDRNPHTGLNQSA